MKWLEHIEKSILRESHRYNSNQTDVVRWVPLIGFYGGEKSLGLSENGKWVIGGNDSVYEFSNSSEPVFFLPCLEKDYNEFAEELTAALNEKSIPPELRASFPFLSILKTGLLSSSSHWLPLAQRWLNDIPLTEKLAAMLHESLKHESRIRMPERVSDYLRHWRKELAASSYPRI